MEPSTGIEKARLAAAARGASLVKEGMLVGLGSGRASAAAIRALGNRMREEKLQFTGVPTSDPSRKLAMEMGIPLVAPEEVGQLDLTLDGADEADSDLNVIKGGGGALVREKLLAQSSSLLVLMIESPKWVEKLGQFHLPIAVIPFAWQSTAQRVRQHCKDLSLRLRDGQPYRTDDNLLILDLITGPIEDAASLEKALKGEVGVAEVGLFIGLCDRMIIGQEDGTITERSRGPAA